MLSVAIGCGKSSLVHLICYNQELQSTSGTIGCAIEVKVHEQMGNTFFLEFWDLGGSEQFREDRQVFMEDVHAILFVYDRTTPKSREHLMDWVDEFVQFQSRKPGSEKVATSLDQRSEGYDPDKLVRDISARLKGLPFFIAGNKDDLTKDKVDPPRSERHCPTSVKGLNCQAKLDAFFNKIVAARLSEDNRNSASHHDSRRVANFHPPSRVQIANNFT